MERLRFELTLDNQNLMEDMKKAYYECPTAVKYVKALQIPDEIVEEQIHKLFDFVSDINYCSKCPGINNCKKENPLLVSKITYNGGLLGTELSPCKKIIERIKFEKQFQIRDFSDDWLDVKLKDLDNSSERKKVFMKYLKFRQNKDFEWIYLTGKSGTGRSLVAATITLDAASLGLGPICYLNSAQRIRELSELASKKSPEFQKKLDQYCNARILVLDDFGNEFINDYIRDTIVYPLLSTRSKKKLFTIFTSDFTVKQIGTLYGTSKAGQLRAEQLIDILKTEAKTEIDLGSLAVY